MRTDPEPDDIASVLDGECTMRYVDARRPECADFLETQRSVSRILLELRESLVGSPSDFR
jgi:hypothetical protein